MPLSVVACPNCGQPSLFPNVRAADDPAEVAALETRRTSATKRAEKRGVRPTLEAFVAGIESTAEIVMPTGSTNKSSLRPATRGSVTRPTDSDNDSIAKRFLIRPLPCCRKFTLAPRSGLTLQTGVRQLP